MERSACMHEDRHSDSPLDLCCSDVRSCDELTHFTLGSRHARLAMQVLRNGGRRRKTKLQQRGAFAPVGGGLGLVPPCQNSERMRARFEGMGGAAVHSTQELFAPEVAPVWCLLIAWWRCKNGRDGQVLRIHDEGPMGSRTRGGARGAQVHSTTDGCLPRCRRGWSRRSSRCVLQRMGSRGKRGILQVSGFHEGGARLVCGGGLKKRGTNADADTWADDAFCKTKMTMRRNSANNEHTHTQKTSRPDVSSRRSTKCHRCNYCSWVALC